MNKNMLNRAVLILLFFFCGTYVISCFAQSEQKKSDQEDKVPACEESSNYKQLDAIECYRDYLSGLEENMKAALQKIYTNNHSHYGEDGDNEMRTKIKSAQSGWQQYKDNHCQFDYYSKAATHPPSHGLRAIRCKVFMTRDRLDEINKTYRKL